MRALVARRAPRGPRRSGRSPSGPRAARAACAARPRTVPRNVSAPACAQTTAKPVGSGIRQASKRRVALERRERAEPAVLLRGDAAAARPRARPRPPRAAPPARAAPRPRRPSCRPRRARARSRPSIAPDHGPWRHGSLPGRDDVDVAVQAEPRPARAPGSVTASAEQLVARRLLARVVRDARAAPRGRARRARASRPELRGARGEPLERGALVAGDARDPHERREVARRAPRGRCSAPTPPAARGASCRARPARARPSPKPAARSASSSAGRPATSPSAAGIVAPSKSEPSATASIPASSATCAACAAIVASGVSASSAPSARRKPTW